MRSDKLDKIIVQSALSTLGSILILCIIAFAIAALFFPSTLMRMSYQVGDDSGAMKYAYRVYKDTGEIYYIAYATEVAIGIDNTDDIELYGELFIEEGETFDEYCRLLDESKSLPTGSYRQYIYHHLALSEYELGKSDEALEHAKEAIGTGFPQNNAFSSLLFAAIQNNDEAFVKRMMTEMEKMTPEAEDERLYLGVMLTELYKILPNEE